MDKELKEKIAQELKRDDKNEYSIYDYLKKTPSIFIAIVSTIIAIVTFFAKLMTIISVRQELAYWGISPDYITSTNESIIYSATISIIYAFATVMLSMWFSTTYEVYLPQKRLNITMNYFKKTQRKDIKQIKAKIKKGIASNEEQIYLNDLNHILKISAEIRKHSAKEFLLNILPILLLTFVNTLFFGTITANKNIAGITITCFIIQVISLFVLAKVYNRKTIDRRKIKNECLNVEFIKKQLSHTEGNKFPIKEIYTNGIRSFMKNINILMVVIVLFINCISMCASSVIIKKDPIANDKSIQTVSINETLYAVVYQNDNQYFLEEASIIIEKIENKEEYKCLTIYTNKQRIITTNDIIITIETFDDITKVQN